MTPEEYDDYDGDLEDYEPTAFEEAMEECGLLPDELGGGCTKAGSEHCDFDCPIRFLDRLLDEAAQ